MHHVEPLGESQLHRVGMVREYCTGDSLARTAFMHHADQGHNALKHYAALKGLEGFLELSIKAMDTLLVSASPRYI